MRLSFWIIFFWTVATKERGCKMAPDMRGSLQPQRLKKDWWPWKRRSIIDEMERDIEPEISPKTPEDGRLVQCSFPDDPQSAWGKRPATQWDLSNTFQQIPASYLDFTMLWIYGFYKLYTEDCETLEHRVCQSAYCCQWRDSTNNKQIFWFRAFSRPQLLNVYFLVPDYKLAARCCLWQ